MNFCQFNFSDAWNATFYPNFVSWCVTSNIKVYFIFQHEKMKQKERDVRMEEFITGKRPVLITTDARVRDMELRDIPLIINYDMPFTENTYITRYVFEMYWVWKLQRRGTQLVGFLQSKVQVFFFFCMRHLFTENLFLWKRFSTVILIFGITSENIRMASTFVSHSQEFRAVVLR